MQSIKVTQLSSNLGTYLFNVNIGEFEYEVSLSEEYYQKLTNGQSAVRRTPVELVKKSFEFLLGKESPASILKQFDLAVISHYFSDYEDKISR